MAQERVVDAGEESLSLNWTDEMDVALINALQEQHDLGKRSDKGFGFKPEAWAICVAEVQNVYSGKEAITVDKLKDKLDYWEKRWYDWTWVGKQSGIRRYSHTELYTAAGSTWETIIARNPRLNWCKTTGLTYEEQLTKLFEGRSACGQKAASFSTLQNNRTTSNQVFNPRLSDNTRKHIHVRDDDDPSRKRARLSNDSAVRRASDNESTDEIPSTPKGNRKESTASEVAHDAKRVRELCEQEREQRGLPRISPETQVMCKIKETYADVIDKLSYEEYARLALLLRKPHDEAPAYTGAEFYALMDGSSPKFCHELMKRWIRKIKTPPITSSLPLDA